MFRPRHAYKSPVTNRYRGKAKGCPVFNNIIEIDSHMVEQHDECLECLAKLKNRTELYRTLADNNKPSNNVIKSLQRLSSSASNNRLKTCLQFHIIKVNEKSIPTQQPASGAAPSTTLTNGACVATSPKYSATTNKDAVIAMVQPESQLVGDSTIIPPPPGTRHLTKRQKSYLNRSRQLEQKQQLQKQKLQQHDQLASPPQDQVSSTQDGQIGPTKDDHDCQTSPPMLTTTHIDEQLTVSGDNKSSDEDDASPKTTKIDEHKNDEYICAQTTQSSPHINNNSNALTTSTTTNTTAAATNNNINNNNNNNNNNMNTSPMRILDLHESPSNISTIDSDTKLATTNRWESKNQPLNNKPNSISTSTTTNTTDLRLSPVTKRRRTQNSLSSDQETSSVASWSLASYAATSPPSPISSASSTSSIDSASDSSSSSYCSSSSCLSSARNSPSPSPLSSPDIVNELKGPRLRLSEQKIRKIKKKPVLFDDLYYYSDQPSMTSTPTTSSGCSPGQHSNTTQNSEQSSSCRSLGFIATYTVNHMFQAPPTFVNYLKPCNLPVKSQEASQASAPQVTTKVEMINCAICGIKDKPPNISKIYGQKSCALCMKFFAAFLQNPQQLYCAHDGDCLMTFDSRCQACWIKICLQKFNIDEEHRKIGHKYSPKLLSSPNVSLITIDTSLTQ